MSMKEHNRENQTEKVTGRVDMTIVEVPLFYNGGAMYVKNGTAVNVRDFIVNDYYEAEFL